MQSDIMETLVVQRYRNEIASIWRQARDITREYDEVTNRRSMITVILCCLCSSNYAEHCRWDTACSVPKDMAGARQMNTWVDLSTLSGLGTCRPTRMSFTEG